MYKLKLLLPLIIIPNIYSQSGWLNMMITNDGTQYQSIHFIDENTGWAVGLRIGFPEGCKIGKSINGGLNWFCQLDYPYPMLYDVFFLNINTGWAAGRKIYKTSNSGLNWIDTFTPSGGFYTSFYSCFFIDSSTGYFVGTRIPVNYDIGMMFKTTNGGNTFDSISILPSNELRDIFFTNSQTGWVVGSININGLVMKTTNSGNFYSVNTGFNNSFYSIYFVNENTGWIGGSGVLLKTINGGNNWVNQIAGYGVTVTSIQFINSNLGWFCGDSVAASKIYHTTNGGSSWSLQLEDAGWVPKLFFINENKGWAVGGLLNRRTTNGGNPIGITQISKEIPEIYSLHQNYPNPFNPSTTISFEIPLSRGLDEGRGVLVKLIVYDLLSREVAALVNEQLLPGTYEVEWDGTKLPSGTYFYRFESGSYSETKKMILLK